MNLCTVIAPNLRSNFMQTHFSFHYTSYNAVRVNSEPAQPFHYYSRLSLIQRCVFYPSVSENGMQGDRVTAEVIRAALQHFVVLKTRQREKCGSALSGYSCFMLPGPGKVSPRRPPSSSGSPRSQTEAQPARPAGTSVLWC